MLLIQSLATCKQKELPSAVNPSAPKNRTYAALFARNSLTSLSEVLWSSELLLGPVALFMGMHVQKHCRPAGSFGKTATVMKLTPGPI